MTESFGGRMQPCHEPHLPRIGTGLATRPFDPAGRTVAPGRVAALTAYVVLLGVWIDVLGVPNDTLQVFVWLWIGTMAWRIHAPWRSHLDFLRDWWMPVLGLVVYFYSRGPDRRAGTVGPGPDAHHPRPVAGRRGHAHRATAGGLVREPVRQGQRAAPLRRVLHHRVRHTLPRGPHDRRGAVDAESGRVAAMDAEVPQHQLRCPGRLHRLSDGASVDGVADGRAGPGVPDHQQGLVRDRPGPDRPDPAGRRQSCGGDAVPARRHVVPDRDVRRPAAELPWRWLLVLYPVSMSTALVYYAEHYVVDILAGALLAWLVLVGASLWERRRSSADADRPPTTGATVPAESRRPISVSSRDVTPDRHRPRK